MLKLYGLGSCDTCRKARSWLEQRNIDYTYHDVRSDGLDADMLTRWTQHAGWETLLNKRSLTWRKVPEADRNAMDAKRAVGAMLEYPTLVKRPVLEGEDFIEIGFSPEGYAERFS